MRTASVFILAALVALTAAVTRPDAAAAATAECIPAARFATLARITDGSMSQLAEVLGLPGKMPPEEGCRAVLLSGPIDQGSAAALLVAIERNKGWLAHVYIATEDGDLREEIALAQVMRDFELTGTLVERSGVYAPDFLYPPETLPASVSNSWSDADLSVNTPLEASFKDYLENTDRKISAARCGAGCWTILAGAVERRFLVRGDLAFTKNTATADSREARIRYAARLAMGPKVQLVQEAFGYRANPAMANFADFDRKFLDADCKPAVEYADTLGGEIAKISNRFAEKDFPYMRLGTLLPRVRRFRQAIASAELCMRKAMTRHRLTVFEQQCGGSCDAKLKAIEAAAATGLARFESPANVEPPGSEATPSGPSTGHGKRGKNKSAPVVASPAPVVIGPPPVVSPTPNIQPPTTSAPPTAPIAAAPNGVNEKAPTDPGAGQESAGSGASSALMRHPQRRR